MLGRGDFVGDRALAVGSLWWGTGGLAPLPLGLDWIGVGDRGAESYALKSLVGIADGRTRNA